jgi:hypothetical protein
MRRFGKILITRRIVINALRNVLMVGTLLNMIHQGRHFLNGLEIGWEQALFNFMTPHAVAFYSTEKNQTERSNDGY